MSKQVLTTAAAALAVCLAGAPATAAAQDSSAGERARQTTSSTGETINDAWILTKVKSQFVGVDALDDSDINVDVKNGVVTLKGTVAAEAGRARALEVARKTEGVVRVVDRLTIGQANRRSGEAREEAALRNEGREIDRDAAAAKRDAERKGREAGREVKEETKEAGREVKEESKEAAAETKEAGRKASDAARETAREGKEEAREAAREGREATGTAGQAVSDGWITTKVKASFVGENALEGSDIKVDTNGHIVTLRGTVPTAAARARAIALAKGIEGVTSVKDELKVGAKQ